MSKPRSKAVHYALRPAKNIERKMMGEALSRLSVIAPLSRYRYVGFGSEFFNDFSLYHQSLGIHDMVSIEWDPTKVERCQFNRPYKCIQVIQGDAHSVLPHLSWSKRTITWLDYTEALDGPILEDLGFILTRAPSGSVLIVTVDAQPHGDAASSEVSPEDPKKRLDQLNERVGQTRVPSGITGSELAGWGLAKASYRIITSEIQVVLNDFNAPLKADARRSFRQCFHFRYKDGHRMLTVGGLVLDPKDDLKLGVEAFDGLEFIRSAADAFVIEPPMLTGREVRHLNQLLPHATTPDLKAPPWLTAEEMKAYREVYRYFPVFAESEL